MQSNKNTPFGSDSFLEGYKTASYQAQLKEIEIRVIAVNRKLLTLLDNLTDDQKKEVAPDIERMMSSILVIDKNPQETLYQFTEQFTFLLRKLKEIGVQHNEAKHESVLGVVNEMAELAKKLEDPVLIDKVLLMGEELF